MGRAAKAKAVTAKQIALEKADYFELRALIRDVEAIDLDALKAAQQFAEKREHARRKSQAKFEALARQHGFDPTATYRWDDQTCQLIHVTDRVPARGR